MREDTIPSPVSSAGALLGSEQVSTIVDKATRKLVDEFRYMRCQASEPLATFLDYLTYGYMIDNVVLIVTGTLHERDVQVRYREWRCLSAPSTSEALRMHLTRDSPDGLLPDRANRSLPSCNMQAT